VLVGAVAIGVRATVLMPDLSHTLPASLGKQDQPEEQNDDGHTKA
jgi:hypothetical protein